MTDRNDVEEDETKRLTFYDALFPSLLVTSSSRSLNRKSSLVGNVTTALNMANMKSPEIIPAGGEMDEDSPKVNQAQLLQGSDISMTGSSCGHGGNLDGSINDDTRDDSSYLNEDLHEIFDNLIIHETASRDLCNEGDEYESIENMVYHNVPSDLSFKDFESKYMSISKTEDKGEFSSKLKQFFIFSSAGKPIYSMNGSDNVVMGYMGILTTIIASFEESTAEEIKSVKIGNDLNMAVLNKNPLIFVTISKLSYESLSLDDGNSLVMKQLLTLYAYLLSLLSKPAITRNFHHRMNYNLRNILSPMDFVNFDELCLRYTYGSLQWSSTPKSTGFEYFLSELFGTPLQSIRLLNRTRTKLGNLLSSLKKVKGTTEIDNPKSVLSGHSKESLGEDLLFSFLATDQGNIISLARHRNHILSALDEKTLFSTVSFAINSPEVTEKEDMWIPICMPDFNPNGFLYAFVKTMELKCKDSVGQERYTLPMVIALLGGNRDSFFQFRQLASYISIKINKSSTLREDLFTQLSNSKLSIYKEMRVDKLKHFVMKHKKYNQYIMSDISEYEKIVTKQSILKLIYYYSALFHSKYDAKLSVNVNVPALKEKKLTSMRWLVSKEVTLGFMYSDPDIEFYCLCNEMISSRELITESLKVMKWCRKYNRRLFRVNTFCF